LGNVVGNDAMMHMPHGNTKVDVLGGPFDGARTRAANFPLRIPGAMLVESINREGYFHVYVPQRVEERWMFIYVGLRHAEVQNENTR
jgi:hypothetical protein